MSRMKIVAILGGLGAAGLIAASAATLGGINADNLGSNVEVVAACQTDGEITVSFVTSYVPDLESSDAADGGYAVTAVDVGSIAETCYGQALDITLANGAGDALGGGTVPTIDGATGQVAITPIDDVPAVDVQRVAIVITGSAPSTTTP